MKNFHYQTKKIDFINQNMIIIIHYAKRDKLFMIHIHLFYFIYFFTLSIFNRHSLQIQ